MICPADTYRRPTFVLSAALDPPEPFAFNGEIDGSLLNSVITVAGSPRLVVCSMSVTTKSPATN